MRVIVTMLAALALGAFNGGEARAQAGDYMECAACQLVLKLVESSAGDANAVVVDAQRQCAVLEKADREACERFYADVGPKFIKALKARRAKGESLETICRAMGYCQ